MSASYDGIIVAGGGARRLGGVSKPSIQLAGRRFIDAAVAALSGAGQVVVVGPVLPLDGVAFTRESPAGGGPVAALAAGLALTGAPLVVVLAADLPFVTALAVEQLVASAPALAVDSAGRDQPLLAAYARGDLLAALPPTPADASLRSVTSALPRLTRIALSGTPPPWFDCDTPEQLAEARQMQVGAS